MQYCQIIKNLPKDLLLPVLDTKVLDKYVNKKV